jgi:hypothetical protein
LAETSAYQYKTFDSSLIVFIPGSGGKTAKLI